MARHARLSLTLARRLPVLRHNYWQSHPALLKQKLQSSTIPIEGAAGQNVPYHGVLHIDLKVLGKEFKAVPTFVVPDSDYRSSVPLLVGTNVIRASRTHLQAAYGPQFLHQFKKKASRVVHSCTEGGERQAT